MIRLCCALIIPVLVGTAATGCVFGKQEAAMSTVTVTSTVEAEASTQSTPSARGTTSAPPMPSAQAAVPGVMLYETFEAQNSVGPNGKPVDATIAGTTYPDSTGMWVGCDGAAATTTYRLSGEYTRLTAVAGLQSHTPDGLMVDVTISADGVELQHFSVGTTDNMPVDVAVSGTDALVVAAIATNPSLCSISGKPYGALGAATLTPVGT